VSASVLIRADASLRIGSGHVMRCLALADALRARGWPSRFVCRAHDGHLAEKIRAAGHAITLLPIEVRAPGDDAGASVHAGWLGSEWQRDAAQTLAAIGGERVPWLVADHYALDARWEAALRPFCARLLVIDDLADRPHACDLLLDQNLGRVATDYARLLPAGTATLIGPKFALLRPEFAARREQSLERRRASGLRRILVGMGGADADNATARVLSALDVYPLPDDCRIVVALGALSPWREQLQAQAERMRHPCTIRCDVADMAALMAESDLAIGAAGGSAWERCCLGLPAIVVVLADNQRNGARALAATGAAAMIASVTDMADGLAPLLRALQADERRMAMSSAASKLADGQGIGRLCEAMEQLACQSNAQRD
jgi:UDP-2,4-diacetamido-2,4,6-trideoxy-beta-L-altropyranose hydrolase